MDQCILQPGTLKHLITIQSKSATRDASGQPGSTWTTVLTTRASIESTASLSFKWSFQNSVLAANATDCITLRYPVSVDIVPGMQIIWNGDTYLVQDVDNVQRRNRVIVLACIGVDTGSGVTETHL
ncbi:MAG: phage head closure protein [Terracidiphilus sp.]|jgi:SPP1 family predicted phage head-tail adaptor